MRTLQSTIFLFVLGAFFSQVRAQDPCLSLVWADEFDYTGVPDPDKWDYDIGGSGWGNNELQYYTDRESNAAVANGMLTITARKEGFGGRGYTSARLVTREKGDWLYGRFEIKAKLPYGRGTWPAIWMLPTDWEYGGWPASGEIDIMEHVGYDQGRIHGTIHTEAYNHQKGTQKSSTRVYDDVSTDFHVYAIEWYEDRIEWFIDDVKYFTFRNENKTFAEWPFDKRFHLILNIAVGGDWGGAEGIDENIWPQEMVVDYVRVYGFGVSPEITGDAYTTAGASDAVYATTAYTGDVTYTWSVPTGATITSGQGTPEITVDWGNTAGTVSVEYGGETGCDVTAAEVDVAFITEPDTDPYPTVAFEAGVSEAWQAAPGTGNEITLTEESDGSVRIDYTVNDVLVNPQVIIPFAAPLDLSEHRELSLEVKGTGSSQPVLFYLEDVFGTQTNATNFLVNVPGDDAFVEYAFDYTDKWLSNFPTTGKGVDSAKIEGLRIFVNEGSGTFWIKNIAVARPEEEDVVQGIREQLPQGWALYPNPVIGHQLTLQHTEPIAALTLRDVQGRTLSIQHTPIAVGTQLDLRHATPGLYWLVISPVQGDPIVQKVILR